MLSPDDGSIIVKAARRLVVHGWTGSETVESGTLLLDKGPVRLVIRPDDSGTAAADRYRIAVQRRGRSGFLSVMSTVKDSSFVLSLFETLASEEILHLETLMVEAAVTIAAGGRTMRWLD